MRVDTSLGIRRDSANSYTKNDRVTDTAGSIKLARHNESSMRACSERPCRSMMIDCISLFNLSADDGLRTLGTDR